MLLSLHIVLPVLSFYLKACHSRQRHDDDPYIVCTGPPLTHANGLPLEYSEERYSTSLALCSVAHGAAQNAGCSCTSDRVPVQCHESVADSTLFNHEIGYGRMTIPLYCTIFGCHCRTPRELSNRLSTTQPVSASVTRASQRPSRVINDPQDTFFPNPFTDMIGPFPSGDTCGVGCSRDEDCQSCAKDPNAADTFKCRAAQQSKFNPTTGAATFLSMCLVSASIGSLNGKNSGNRGKRDVELPCPCNSTYISHGCCNAKSGLLWEPAELYLGKLVSQDES